MDTHERLALHVKLARLMRLIKRAIKYEGQRGRRLTDLETMLGDVEGYYENMSTTTSLGWADCLPRFNEYYHDLTRRYGKHG